MNCFVAVMPVCMPGWYCLSMWCTVHICHLLCCCCDCCVKCLIMSVTLCAVFSGCTSFQHWYLSWCLKVSVRTQRLKVLPNNDRLQLVAWHVTVHKADSIFLHSSLFTSNSSLTLPYHLFNCFQHCTLCAFSNQCYTLVLISSWLE